MALATIGDVTARLEDEPTPEMEAMIEAYLEDASDQARFYGSREWTEVTCPDPIRRMVASAVARFLRNPDGLSQSRAGDETLAWQQMPEVGTVYFTEREVERLQTIGNPRLPSFGTIQMLAHGSTPPPRDILMPLDRMGGRPFPLFRSR